ncbi:DMT family transporter [Marinomonas rhizomae]|uniref:EamA domain-containing membrane protein RarD n=1 Tax=Marinomonas rhizomae TaxID=491948 RepID=A0A366IW51_9GAMM|nr:DMT family transporter [Marinomonas rhizomae]RBP79031.1 EamA domain-containing membrane protein RarD [Marinomonas rhizomae]RNF71255.1 DMT family transporter [Marinomonas rhizomae]
MILSAFHKVPVGIRYVLMSAAGFALMATLVKLVSEQGIPVFEIVAARCLVSFVISYADVKRKGIAVFGHNKKLLFARGFIGTLALMCVYYALATLPLAEATLLQYIHPVFTALLALVFLGERVNNYTIACIFLSLSGLLFIAGADLLSVHHQGLPTLSVALALLGAMGSAIAYVIVRRLSKTEDSSVIILYFPMIAFPLSVLLLGGDFVMPSFDVLILLIFVGVFTQAGQFGLTKAMQTLSAGIASAYSYIQLVFTVLLGWLVFSEVPVMTTWAGGVLIICGALINVYGDLKKKY